MRPILITLILIMSAFSVFTQRTTSSPRPKPSVSKPTASPSPEPTPDESAEFESARKIEDAEERAARLKQFLEDFPETRKRTEALELLTVALADAANMALINGNSIRAINLFEEAVDKAPEPISKRLFTEVIVKFPNLLFVNNERPAALKLARSIERRSAENLRYLLQITSFYVSIEDSEGALRTAKAAIELDPGASQAHQMLGLAHRLNFDLESAAASYAKALELDPDSRSTAQNLADIKRALGKPIEALEIYDRLIASDENDATARAGRVIVLFDLGRKQEAEAAFDEALKLAAGNVTLIGNVAYWYAANGDAANAILHAEEAIDLEPRYIWSHLALGRGLMMQGRFADAEKVLTAARRFGRFPTLEYEIAKARIALGFYRDALEDVRDIFDVENGNISVALGGRVMRTDRSFAQVLADERRASIFEPKSSTEDELDVQLKRLLAFDKALKVNDDKSVESTGRELAAGTDPMRLYRVLFTANVLLDKRLLPEVALEIVQSASSGTEDALKLENASAAVMASELYESRRAAFLSDQYLVVPEVPKPTLSSIIRGRIEDVAGRALFAQERFEDSAVRFRRALTVLPANSVWWRNSMWWLGTAQEAAGKEKEALDSYVASYRSEPGSGSRYLVIRSLYQKVHGTLEGLETLVGPSPLPIETAAIADTANKTDTEKELREEKDNSNSNPEKISGEEDNNPSLRSNDLKTTEDLKPPATKAVDDTSEKTRKENQELLLKASEEPKSNDSITKQSETKTELASSKQLPSIESKDPGSVIEQPANTKPNKARAEDDIKTEGKLSESKPSTTKTLALFDPVVITVPSKGTTTISDKTEKEPDLSKGVEKQETPDNGQASPIIENLPTSQEQLSAGYVRSRLVPGQPVEEETVSCSINVSQNNVVLAANGGSILLLVGTGAEQDVSLMKAVSSSPVDLEIKPEPSIEGVSGRALFLLRSISSKTGLYQVAFSLPCGRRIVNVNVQ